MQIMTLGYVTCVCAAGAVDDAWRSCLNLLHPCMVVVFEPLAGGGLVLVAEVVQSSLEAEKTPRSERAC